MNAYEKSQCLEVLDSLKQSHNQLYMYFAAPAMSELSFDLQTEYQEVIHDPRDLETIRLNTMNNKYESIEFFKQDVLLCFENAKKFCSLHKEFKIVKGAAEQILKIFTKAINQRIKAMKDEKKNLDNRNKPGRKSNSSKNTLSKESDEQKKEPPRTSRRSAVAASKQLSLSSSQKQKPPSITRSLSMKHICITGLEIGLYDKLIKSLKNESNAAILLHPVPENAEYYQHYMARILNPMDFETLTQNLLDNKKYIYVEDFMNDARLIFANAIRYNCHNDKLSINIRKGTMNALYKFESRFLDWNIKEVQDTILCPPMRELKICLSALEAAFKITSVNPEALPTNTNAVINFIDPVEIQLTGTELSNYRDEIPYPMDFGTITSNVILAKYTNSYQFLADVELVYTNCLTYWNNDKRTHQGGEYYIQDVTNLKSAIDNVLNDENIVKSLGLMHVMQIKSASTFSSDNKRNLSSGGNGQNKGRRNSRGKNKNYDEDLIMVDDYAIYDNFTSSVSGEVRGGGAAVATAAAASGGGGGGRGRGRPSLKLSLKGMKSNSSISSSVPDTMMDHGLLPPAASVDVELVLLPKPHYRNGVELANFYLPTRAPPNNESENQLNRRAMKYCKDVYLGCLEELQQHFIKPSNPNSTLKKVLTHAPFQYKVDPKAIPTYARFLQDENREEMYLSKISRSARSDKYGYNISMIIKDMKVLQDNAHAFNPGDENVEIRIMVDCIVHYFTYLIISCLNALLRTNEEAMKKLIFTSEVIELLQTPIASDVYTFLACKQEEEEIKVETENARRVEAAKVKEAELIAQKKREESMSAATQIMYATDGTGALYGATGDFDMQMNMLHNTEHDEFDDHFDDGRGGGGGGGGGKGSKSGKGKGKGAGDVGMGAPVLKQDWQFGNIHTKTGWELDAAKVWDRMAKHPYVDYNKDDKKIADFFHPVVENFPHIADEYLACVERPMDMSILKEQLDNGMLMDAEEFYDDLTLIFKNMVIYNQREGIPEQFQFYSQEMVEKCNHLLSYATWLCLEMMPVLSEEEESKMLQDGLSQEELDKKMGILRHSNQVKERILRETVIKNSAISSSAADCKKLVARLRSTKNRQEATRMSWFQVPPIQPSDYAVYVRKPMDIGRISTRLEKGSSAMNLGGYNTYGEVLADLRLVFKNSIKYNSNHLQDDGSRIVHEAATEFLMKLENLIPNFTVDAAEKVLRDKIHATKEEKSKKEIFEKKMAQKAELEAFEEAETAKRIATDSAFRHDLDIDMKIKRSTAQQEEFELQESLKRSEEGLNHIEGLGTMMGADMVVTSGLDDGSGGAKYGSNTVGGNVGNNSALSILQAIRLQGSGFNGEVPAHLLASAVRQKQTRKLAWDVWEPTAKIGKYERAVPREREKDQENNLYRGSYFNNHTSRSENFHNNKESMGNNYMMDNGEHFTTGNKRIVKSDMDMFARLSTLVGPARRR